MAYQSWNNQYFGKNITSSFKIKQKKDKDGHLFFKANDNWNTMERFVYKPATQTLHPSPSASRCGLLLMPNLAYPEWVTVNCSQKLLSQVVCANHTLHTSHRLQSSNSEWHCQKLVFLTNKNCLILSWFDGNKMNFNTIINTCKLSGMTSITDVNITQLDFLFKAPKWSEIQILCSLSSDAQVWRTCSYKRLWLNYIYMEKSVEANRALGYYVCQKKAERRIQISTSILFVCLNGRVISTMYICDGMNDCNDHVNVTQESDEMNCRCDTFTSYCKEICLDSTCICTPLYYKSMKGNCLTYRSTLQNLIKSKTSEGSNYFKCLNNVSIAEEFVDDIVPDCQNEYDEPTLKKLLLNEIYTNCSAFGQLPCIKGHSRCYNVTYICIYQLTNHYYLIPCRDGAHLENCKHFQCNGRYKCPKYYCIPWSYVCDGKWDCPYGYDEALDRKCGASKVCLKQYKCKHHQMCIHINDVCDGKNDCPLHDDESLCQLMSTSCPTGCTCFNFAIFCHNTLLDLNKINARDFIAVHFTSINFTSLLFLENYKSLLNLQLPYNSLSNICNSLNNNPTIAFINLSHNIIKYIFYTCFIQLDRLKILLLNNNKIHFIATKAFASLDRIILMDLSHNYIKTIYSNTFLNITLIHILNLVNNSLVNIQFNMFNRVPIEAILTEDYHICCIVSVNTECSASKPWYASCLNLLPNYVVKISLILISLTILISNSFSLISNVRSVFQSPQHRIFSFTVASINLGDFLFGFYLCILWMADISYQASFIVNEIKWRNNIICHIAFAVVLSFSLVMPILLGILSLSRLMVVIFPFKSKFKDMVFVVRLMFGCWVAVISASLVITAYFVLNQGIPSFFCSPFMDTSGSIHEIKYITLLVATFQVMGIIAISMMNIILLKSLKKETTVRVSKGINKAVLVQIFLVSGSNLICWVPSSSIFLATLFLSSYPINLLIWNTIAIVPINSIVNPIVFLVISFRSYRRDMTKVKKREWAKPEIVSKV